MKWFWKRNEEEMPYFMAKSQKPNETLSQVADKLLIRKMKRDPDGYGLKVAEKVKGVGKDEENILAQLRQLKELKKLLSEFGGEEGNPSLTQSLLSVLPDVIQLLPRFLTQQSGQQEQAVQQYQLGQAQAVQAKPLPAPPQGASLSDLVGILELEPQEALEQLKAEHPEWADILKNNTYEQLLVRFKPLANNPVVEELLKERQNWLKRLVELAHKV